MVASDMMNALMALCEEKHIDQGELIRNLEQFLSLKDVCSYILFLL